MWLMSLLFGIVNFTKLAGSNITLCVSCPVARANSCKLPKLWATGLFS